LGKFDLIFFFLSFLTNINVFCRKMSENLSFLAGAEQLIYRTPPLAASGFLR